MERSGKISVSLVCLSLILTDIALFASLPAEDILFRISRSHDADEIFYEVSLDSDGRLYAGSPVDIYWVRKTKVLVREPLTWLQNRYSYGIRFIETSSDHAIFKFVSFDKEFKLEKAVEGRFRVYTILDNRPVVVERIFVQFDGGTFLAPVISEVILYGRDVESGILLTENIKP
jgi:hypothetical protein